MAFGNGSGEEGMMSEINVTPLVDVMLVLLVVFIITAPLLAPQALNINLPRTAALPGETKPQPLRLVIDSQGRLMLNEAALTDAALEELLRARAADAGLQLQIEADEAVRYGRVAEVMALAQQAGVSKLSFITLARH